MATAWSEEIIAGVTLVKAQHLNELKTAIQNERTRRGLGAMPDCGTIKTGEDILTKNMDGLRDGLKFSPLSLTDNPLNPSGIATVIKKVHIDELRFKVNALESNPYINGAPDCNSSCTGLCVSCTSCIGSCIASCANDCSDSCRGGCKTSCTGSCSGGCSSSCTGYCTGCSGACQDTCKYGCYQSCSIYCSGPK